MFLNAATEHGELVGSFETQAEEEERGLHILHTTEMSVVKLRGGGGLQWMEHPRKPVLCFSLFKETGQRDCVEPTDCVGDWHSNWDLCDVYKRKE